MALAFEVFRNKRKVLNFEVLDALGAPINLDGKTLRFSVKESTADADPALISKTTGAGITHSTQSGDTLGEAALEIDPGDTNTADFPDSRRKAFVCELELLQVAGEPELLDRGVFTVIPGVRKGV